MSDTEAETSKIATSSDSTSDTSKRAQARSVSKERLEKGKQKQQDQLDDLQNMVRDLLHQRDEDRRVIQEMEKRLHVVLVKEEEKHGLNVKEEDDMDGSQAAEADEDEEQVPVQVVKQKAIVLPRVPKSLTTFTGEGGSSVRAWLQQFETMRIPLRWDDETAVALCAMNLADRAQQWYQDEGRKKSVSASWKTFSASLLKRFTPVVNQLFIPKYTRTLAQRSNEKSVDFMDRVGKNFAIWV
jgi:hypothetical protein